MPRSAQWGSRTSSRACLGDLPQGQVGTTSKQRQTFCCCAPSLSHWIPMSSFSITSSTCRPKLPRKPQRNDITHCNKKTKETLKSEQSQSTHPLLDSFKPWPNANAASVQRFRCCCHGCLAWRGKQLGVLDDCTGTLGTKTHPKSAVPLLYIFGDIWDCLDFYWVL